MKPNKLSATGFSKILLSLTLIAMCFLAQAKVTLPPLIANNMVLQQQAKPSLWGNAKPEAPVTIYTSWNKKAYTVKATADGTWTVKVTTPAAGGPYEISFNDGETLKVKNVMIGEVWFCSGQSNMEMTLNGNSSPILNANEIILNADNPQLRLFTIKTANPLKPAPEVKGEWAESTSESARRFSAIAF